jgi:tRNA pseudouridine55 synthase
MGRRTARRSGERPGAAGFLLLDKPRGWTSHDAVDAARGWLGTRRVGHLGTLDPLATGVLPLAVREATKLAAFLQGGAKAYVGTLRLGEETDTLDADGRTLRRHAGALPNEAAVEAALARFVGEISQVPPMFSAVKHHGVPLHRLAREGRVVERAAKRVRIDRLALRKYAPPDLDFEVECSAGTYVRALAHDLGRELGCGAHLLALRRTRSGPFTLDQAFGEGRLARAAERGEIEALLVPMLNALGLPALRLSPEEVRRVRHGGELAAPEPPLVPGTRLAALEPAGDLLAILEVRPGRRLRPLRVLRP